MHRSQSSQLAKRPGLGAVGALTLLLTVFAPSTGRAQPTDEELECMSAFEQTQEARAAGNLLKARALTEACIVDTCHEVMKESCTKWREELASEIPSITVRAVDESGAPLGGATVIIDGQEKLSSAGRSLELDPGTHSIEISATGYESTSQTIELAPGDQKKTIELALVRVEKPTEVTVSPAPEPERRRPLWPAFVLGGVSAAGFATLGVFGSQARAGDRDLDSCAPTRTCDPGEVDDVKANYALANAGLVVGIVGAAGAVGWTIFALSPPRRAEGEAGRASTAVAVRVGPRMISAQGSF